MSPHLLDDKPVAYAAGAALLGAVLAPVRQSWRRQRDRTDGFPLSYYPMFSARRSEVGTVVHLVGVEADGRTRVLHHRYAGTGGLNQVRRQIRRRVEGGGAASLAEEAARAVAVSSRPKDSRLVEVRVVTSQHRYDEFFAGDREPLSQTVHAAARIQRPIDRSPR